MSNILEQFKFGPWHGGDPPGPLGPWVFEHLDKNQIVAMAHAALEYNRAVLDAQMKVNTRMQEIIGSTGKPAAK
jgi:hypothetical protein